MRYLILVTIAAGALAGCATPTRTSDPSAFKLLAQGQVDPRNAHLLADCLLDGFNDSHPFLATLSARTQRRSDSFRIETVYQGNVYVSADVKDNGSASLFESNYAALINTSGEREAFGKCLKKFELRP